MEITIAGLRSGLIEVVKLSCDVRVDGEPWALLCGFPNQDEQGIYYCTVVKRQVLILTKPFVKLLFCNELQTCYHHDPKFNL